MTFCMITSDTNYFLSLQMKKYELQEIVQYHATSNRTQNFCLKRYTGEMRWNIKQYFVCNGAGKVTVSYIILCNDYVIAGNNTAIHFSASRTNGHFQLIVEIRRKNKLSKFLK